MKVGILKFHPAVLVEKKNQMTSLLMAQFCYFIIIYTATPLPPSRNNSLRKTPRRNMADYAGFIFIENAIPADLARQGADAIAGGLIVKEKLEKVTEFLIP